MVDKVKFSVTGQLYDDLGQKLNRKDFCKEVEEKTNAVFCRTVEKECQYLLVADVDNVKKKRKITAAKEQGVKIITIKTIRNFISKKKFPAVKR